MIQLTPAHQKIGQVIDFTWPFFYLRAHEWILWPKVLRRGDPVGWAMHMWSDCAYSAVARPDPLSASRKPAHDGVD